MRRKLYKTFPDATTLASYLLPELERTGISLVSFDVFDTLIHRRAHPDAIVWGVAQWLAREMACFRSLTPLDTLEGRHRAYVRLIQAKAAQGLDLDVSLDELVLPWVQECAGGTFDGDESLAWKLAEVEVTYETASCFCNPTFLTLSAELKNRGIRLVYTSDMYLGAKYIDRILDVCGYGETFEGGYVSGDLSLLKRTGRLFDVVLTNEGLHGHELFHIGDSELSDGVRPAEKGIRALVHKESRLVRRHRRMAYDFQRVKVDRAWLGMLVAQFAEAGLDERGTPEEAYGRRVLGPIFTSFIHRLLERCRDENICKVFFVAREGYVLKRLFDQLMPQIFKEGKQTPVGIYLGVSRLTTFLAAMRGFSLREIAATFNNTKHYSIGNLFAPLGIRDDVLLRIARKHGLEDINEPLPSFFMQWPPLFRLLDDSEILSIIRSKSAETKQKLELYLEELGFFDQDRVAVIDVGWSGQIQDNLYSVIKDRADCPQIFGMYLGTTLAAHWRKTPANWMEGILTDGCHVGWSGKTAFEFVQGLEAVVRSPHGTVVGYEEDGFGVRPMFKEDNDSSRRAELEDEPMLALFQQGILDYGRLYSEAVAMFNVNSADTLPYARMMLDRMVRFPRLEEARWFLSIRNVSDLGSSEICKLGIHEGIPFWQFRRLHGVLQSSFWRYGVIALQGSWLFQWFFAVAAALLSIPPRRQRLNPGVVFGQYDTVRKEQERLDLKRSRDTNLLDVIEQNYRAQSQNGKRRRSTVCLHDHTFPLSLLEVFRSYTALKAACLMCRLTGRHVPYQDGISIRGWLGRAAAQSGTLKQVLQTLRLASCGPSLRSVSAKSLRKRTEPT